MNKQSNTHIDEVHPELKIKEPHFIKRFIRKCWMPLAIIVITMAIVFSLFRALTPWAKQYKGEVEHQLSIMLGQPVTINDMETSWYWFVPVLKLNDVTISDSADHVLQLKKLLVGINLLSSLWHWQIQPGILYVEDAQLTIHQIDDRWEIDGLTQEEKIMTLESTAYIPVLAWLLEQQKIVIKHVSADVYLNDGSYIPLININMTVVNHHGHYRLKGGAKLNQVIATELIILADMQMNSNALHKTKGHAYISLHHFLPIQWRTFLPELPVQLEEGNGDLELWLDVSKGKLLALQSKIGFQDIVWHEPNKTKLQSIESLHANLAWKSTSDGWQLSGDHIILQANGWSWPENTLLIQYKNDQKAYRLFTKTLLLAPLLKIDIDWPDSMNALLAMHPKGELYNTQINIQNGHMDYLLTRFSNLSWEKYHKIPEVRHISGALYWQPTEGRLELDGEHVMLLSHKKPTLTFDKINGAFDWKTLGDTLKMTVKRFVLVHPELSMNADGVLDGYSSTNPGHLRLSLAFLAENAQQWVAYIPSKKLKPKLYAWLTKDVKKIDKASGRVFINGPLSLFPFDKQEGEFSINSYLSGLDLIFAPYWPVTKNINAYLQVNHRTLEADIVHADFKKVEANNIQLKVSDLGLNKERLLVHGQMDAPAKDMLRYVFDSPLRLQLKKLNTLAVKGPLSLDLNLDVPLFPEDDLILARGMVTFDKNTLSFKKSSSPLALDDLSGVLNFTEDGATNSYLTGTFFDKVVDIQVKPIQKPKHYTEIAIKTNTSAQLLRKQFNLPILSLMHGHLQLNGTIALTNDPKQSDHIHIDSPLEGLSIDLPEPFGKDANDKAPLSIDADFVAQDALRLRFNYDNRLSSDLWVDEINDLYTIDHGEIRLGSGDARLNHTKGINVVGSLPVFNWQTWKEVFSKIQSSATMPSGLQQIHFVDVKLGQLIFLHQDFKDMFVSLDKAKDTWLLKLKQQYVAGNLRYQPSSHTLTGHFDYLYLKSPVLAEKQTESSLSTLVPKDIPNLDIKINDFEIAGKRVGSVALKSKSFDKNWQLEQCDISTPAYQLSIHGNWIKNNKDNQTSLQAQLNIKDLEKGLERLDISPAVDAHQGTVQFEGSFNGGIDAFSLENVKGQLQMTLKDGRITHLSHETEQKLGLGKLLSVLSLQTIPRRLKLDFSDLVHDGYSFDIFKGSFTIKNGVLNTNDSYLDGPVAYASMKGDLDVKRHLYDLNLLVTPYITSSLPVVATIVGTPIAGVATWVAMKIINDRMQKGSGYTYKISGPWLDPVVQQVSVKRKVPLSVP